MRFADTRPPVNDGSHSEAFAYGHTPQLPRGFGKLGNRPMSNRYTAARLRVKMRPAAIDEDDWAKWSDEDKRRMRNARKRERQAAR